MIREIPQSAGKSAKPPVLLFKIEQPTPLKRYALRFLLQSLGYPAVESTTDECDLYYGNRFASRVSAVTIREDSSHVLPDDLTRLGANEKANIAFDVVGATARLLTDSVNSSGEWDSFDRLTFRSSFQSQRQCSRTPVVNIFVECLRRPLEHHCGAPGAPLLPPGKKAAIGLSHDVDRLERWADVRGFLRTGKRGLYAARSILLNAIHRHDSFHLIRDLIAFEERLGFTSTFLFATESRYSPYSARHDVAYDIEQPAMRALFGHIQSQGFEIGLHASYNAYRRPERFRTERKRLQSLSGAEIAGVRHHCWHLGREVDETLAMHGQAGFSYDSSIAFNYDLGFRRSVALPYYPWWSREQRPIHVLQLPVFCMDGNLFYRDSSVKEALEQIGGMVATIKQWGGIGVIDWHSDTSHPKTRGFERWGQAYFRLLKRLADESTLWVTNLGELASWFARRNRSLESESALTSNARAAQLDPLRSTHVFL
jgi:hypothetical protein